MNRKEFNLDEDSKISVYKLSRGMMSRKCNPVEKERMLISQILQTEYQV